MQLALDAACGTYGYAVAFSHGIESKHIILLPLIEDFIIKGEAQTTDIRMSTHFILL